MKSIHQRSISLFLSAILLCFLFPSSAAESSPDAGTESDPAPFVDVAEADWFETYVNLCIENGLLNGIGDGRFDPYGTVNVNEALVMAARVLWQTDGGTGDLPQGPAPEEFVALLGEDSSSCPFGTDVETAARYAQTWAWDGMTYLVLRAREEGFALDLEDGPDSPCSRRLFFRSLAFASRELDLTAVNDIDSVPGTRDPDILQLYRAGILSGIDSYGSFDGRRTLTRAEAAAALARVLDPSLRVTFTLSPSPYRSYSLTKLTDRGSFTILDATTNLCVLQGTDSLLLLTLDGELIPWPEGGTPSSALQFYLDHLELGVFASAEAAETGYGEIHTGLMGENGVFAVPLGAYDHIWPAQDGTLIACRGAYGEEAWFLLTSDGELTTQLPSLEGADWRSFNNGLLPLQDAATGLYGFVDSSGSWFLSPRWQNVLPGGFTSGYTAVQDENGLWGVIGTVGQQLFPFQYRWISRAENSPDYTGPGTFVAVDSSGEMVWLSLDGTAFPADPAFAYSNSGSYHNGYAVCWTDEASDYSSRCYLDLSGRVLTETFDWAGPIGSDRRGFVELDGAIYCIEFEEQTLIPAQPDATQEVLDLVDRIFASGSGGVSLRCRLFPGTGLLSLPADDCYGQIRELFAARTWVRQQEHSPEAEGDSRSITLTSASQTSISAYVGSDEISVEISTDDGQTIFFRAEDDPEDLALALAELWDGPELQLALVTVNDAAEDGQELAQAYADAFRQSYQDSGAITEFELRELAPVDQEEADPISSTFRMVFAVQPAEPSSACWQDAVEEEGGWVAFEYEVSLFLDEDGIWRCSWIQQTAPLQE